MRAYRFEDARRRRNSPAMSAPHRDELLGWLKQDTEEGECRVLTNVRCLSEGVDVPSLDAVLFLSARNSQVDVVQSVGRVMRKSPGKKYGYIIIPVVVPSDVDELQKMPGVKSVYIRDYNGGKLTIDIDRYSMLYIGTKAIDPRAYGG